MAITFFTQDLRRRPLVNDTSRGSTAKALTDTRDLESIVVVDISEEILDLAQVVFPGAGTNPLDDPRVEVHVEDGRFFLQTTDRRFDLITSEPPPPKLAGVVNLYTKEYFQLIHDRLGEGGVATYWLPVQQLTLTEAQSIMRAFLDVFGRPSRDTPFERERSCDAQPRQALYLVSSNELQWKIAGGQRIRRLLESKAADPEIVDELYLCALARPPRQEERTKAVAYLAQRQPARQQAIEDLFWAVLTTREFLVNH